MIVLVTDCTQHEYLATDGQFGDIMNRMLVFVLALLALIVSSASAQEVTSPAKWGVTFTKTPDIGTFSLITVEKSNGGQERMVTPGGPMTEITIFKDRANNKGEVGFTLGTLSLTGRGDVTAQGHLFSPFKTTGVLQVGVVIGAGVGAYRDGIETTKARMVFHGGPAVALKGAGGVIRASVELDSRNLFAVRLGAGVRF